MSLVKRIHKIQGIFITVSKVKRIMKNVHLFFFRVYMFDLTEL